MTREWKPGDVADFGSSIAMRTRAGWAYKDGSIGSLAQDDYNPRPLVVIDPEDLEQVKRFVRGIYPSGAATIVDDFQVALRSLVTPPKPDEPTGLGAVVEDEEGALWVKWSTLHRADRNWKRHDEHGGNYLAWSDLAVTEVLSEGVTP